MHRYGQERDVSQPENPGRRLWLQITNDRHIVTIHQVTNGRNCTRFYLGMEVSGHHHKVAWDFLALRPGAYVASKGDLRFRIVEYRALP